jgi:hypothetical protein
MVYEVEGKTLKLIVGRCSSSLYSDVDYSTEDRIRYAIIAIGVATGILAFTAATTAILVSLSNWPIALFLLVVGGGVLSVAWFLGLHRFEELILQFTAARR